MKPILLSLILFLVGIQNAILDGEADGYTAFGFGLCATQSSVHIVYQILFIPKTDPEEFDDYLVVVWGVLWRRPIPFAVAEFANENGDWVGTWYVDLDLDGYSDFSTSDPEELYRTVGEDACETVRLLEERGVLR